MDKIVKELTLGIRPSRDQLQARISELEAEIKPITDWKDEGANILENAGVGFKLGVWWADRPWKMRN